MEADKETEIWYAMRATYRREPDAMRLLEKEKMGCFVPMQYKLCIKKGKYFSVFSQHFLCICRISIRIFIIFGQNILI